MIVLQKIIFFLIFSSIDCSIYIYNTDDSQSVDYYDCIYHQAMLYCRRPRESIPLQRDDKPWDCYHNGTLHSFNSLWMKNINVSTILHEWKSGVDKAEEYSQYRNHINKLNTSEKYVCQCLGPGSFGKQCEYFLPIGKTFDDTVSKKFDYNSSTRQYGGDLVCYETLKCNSGLLCLDWRNICDGIQDCMFGYDEENCDRIEFNECEYEEYRCMNGMCIPEEYFLDGDYDCMDMSDEKEQFEDFNCPIKLADFDCDDRLCPWNQWSCGDGQCITDRIAYRSSWSLRTSCMNRRNQFYSCETSFGEHLWTAPNGQCYPAKQYEELNTTNRTTDDYCTYLLKCALSSGAEKKCPCGEMKDCGELLSNVCASFFPIHYPKGALRKPYVFEYFNVIYKPLKLSSYMILNGTVKCRGYMHNALDWTIFHGPPSVQIFDAWSCRLSTSWLNFGKEGYHPYCHNDSRTFNNYSYQFLDVCASQECLSAYRIKDGIANCRWGSKNDEENTVVIETCSKVRRHRFRCSLKEPTCLYANSLGDFYSHCKNNYDEFWMGTQILLSKIQCNNQSQDGCQFLRRYIEGSWNSHIENNSNVEQMSFHRIPFRTYCDTFWDLSLKIDENITICQSLWVCSQDQWQCYTGQCIYFEWVLDGEWDCPDASDEENIFAVNFNSSHPNFQWLRNATFQKKFADRYTKQPFGNCCNLSIEYPCFPINRSNDTNSIRPCIDLKLIGNSRVDCMGGYDERSAMTHCNRFTALGYHFKCLSTNTCIPYSLICTEGNRCSNNSDDNLWCQYYKKSTQSTKFQCKNGTELIKERCDGKYDCSDGEDEYMCHQGKSSGEIYRKEKQLYGRTEEATLHLPRFPTNTNITTPTNIKTNFAGGSIVLPSTFLLTPDWCNRGIGVYISNGSIVCFCPPQYHGDQCQYHSDRISIILHLNLSQSIYSSSSDKSIVIKLLVLFCHENQVLGTDEFHIRPALEIDVFKKKKTYFHYSRALQSFEMKQKRYFNRSDILTQHPYSIRIEAYHMTLNAKVKRFAVWQYPIYFDYLPVYRFAKVLRLIKSNPNDDDPCVSHPCHPNQECYQLRNEKSKYICLCQSNYSGANCTDFHPLCHNNYCSSNALCQPSYRGLSNGNEYPYCICPVNQIGQRCELVHSMCLQNPCENGGTCLQRSRPNEFSCQCPVQYEGTKCQHKKQAVYLLINQTNTIDYQGIVVQYLQIDYLTFELKLKHQSIYSSLPNSLYYLHSGKIAPEIIILKSYVFEQVKIYLISLQINVTSIQGMTSITEKNRCVDLVTIAKDLTLFQYHYLCRNNQSLFCFTDKEYICICDEEHLRAECFSYNFHLEDCSHCLANGRCLRGGKSEYLCLCPSCHTGRFCQFNFESFSFTLDQLFFNDLLSKNHFIQQITYYLLLIIPCLLFILGLINNTFCFNTFRRRKCLRNGIGQYLLYMSIINQINLTILLIRLIHLTINITNTYSSYPVLNNSLCKISSYLLTSSTRIIYWSSSFIALERMYVTLFLNGQWFKKPHIARRLIAFTILSILILTADELVFIQSQMSSDDGYSSICVLNFPANYSFWKVWHQVVTVINALTPFLINLCCTIAIICVVTKKKIKANQRDSRKPLPVMTATNEEAVDASIEDVNELSAQKSNPVIPQSDVNISEIELSPSNPPNGCRLLIDIFIENKEFIVAPAFTLIPQFFSLPFFIASFSLVCQNLHGNRLRYLLITSYFTTFIPQLTSFFLYISPSSFYSKEWQATNIAKSISGVTQQQPIRSLTIKTCNTDGRTKEIS